ncbi:outer membrane protein assembly factor BamD [Desulfovibrio inopinatus]|uniref:outer membrane protein assembly factor BamD n=1 Tax=Desulfovibrio inopinatus TaxID=102109 RepID=UPI0003FA4540|nr:outer membrane protein assembly factor BamD [Desulfovibrio inopinatus]
MNLSVIRLIAIFLLVTQLNGCGFIDYFFLPPPEDTAQELYEAGRDAMSEKKYSNAIEYFTKLKDRYPFSPYTTPALIALGDALFLEEDYATASDVYMEFESLHPRDEEIPYVLFQIGMSNFKRAESIDMPPDNLQTALQYFYLLEETFPQTEYGKLAGEYILKCRKRMAEHELFVADFYWRTDNYGPAWRRYMYVADNFKDVPEVVEYSKERAALSYLEYQKTLTEDERREIEGDWRQWLKEWL